MYAQCPECFTFFRLKPSDLKAAGGRVRCSRCKYIFNALETLRDELSPEELAEAQQARKPGPKPEAPTGSEDQVADLFDGLDYKENAELDLKADSLDEPEEALAEPVLGELSAEERDAAEAAEIAAAPGPVFEPETQPDQLAAPAREVNFFDMERKRRGHPLLLAAASFLLLLLLAAQLIHWQRFSILEHREAGPWLEKAYALLHLDLDPPRDLAALKVSRTEVSSHPDNARALHLTAVLENTSKQAQPWPALRVDLQDRWGDSVGARYFTPDEYLRNPSVTKERMQAEARYPVELVLVDPGSNAVGFQVDPCFESGDGHVCAADMKH